MNLEDLPEWVWVSLVGLASAITLWWRRQTAGLSFFQEATDDQRDELEKMMTERIKWLVLENDRLKEEIAVLADALNCGDDDAT